MKKYRLKQWYPSLLKDVRVGDIITENGQHYKGVTHKCISYRVEIWQLHPDFWELIEEKSKPLFITDDGVELFDEADKLFIVNKECYKKESEISNIYDKTIEKTLNTSSTNPTQMNIFGGISLYLVMKIL